MSEKGNRMIKLTGLWERENKDGEKRLLGTLSPFSRLVVLPNKRKEREEDPDYIAFIAPVDDHKPRSRGRSGNDGNDANDDGGDDY